MSLIADSLKKALKSSSPGGSRTEFNVIPRNLFRDAKNSSSRQWLWVVIPGAILGFLIYAGAFDKNRTSITQLPLFSDGKNSKPVVAKRTKTAPTPPAEIERDSSSTANPSPPQEEPKARAPLGSQAEKPVSAQEEASSKREKMDSLFDLNVPKPRTEGEVIAPVKKTESLRPDKVGYNPFRKSRPGSDKKRAARPKPAMVLPPASAEKSSSQPGPVSLGKAPEHSPTPEDQVSITRATPADTNPAGFSRHKRNHPPENRMTQGTGPGPTPMPQEFASSSTEPTEPDIFRDSNYFFNRGVFFQDAGNGEQALINFRRAAELDPRNPDVFNNMGVIHKTMGRYKQATDDLLRALHLNPNYVKAYNNLGVVSYMEGNHQGAIANYRKAIQLDPQNLETYNNLAVVYRKMNHRDQAKRVLKKALAIDSSHALTNYNLGLIFEEESNIPNAKYFFRRFLEFGSAAYPELVQGVKTHLNSMG